MIYEYTRYRLTPTVSEPQKGKEVFTARPSFNFPVENAGSHIWKAQDRLDILASEYYGTSALWWVILEANPRYKWEGEIEVGDVLVIPDVERVVERI